MDQPKRFSSLEDWKIVHEDQNILGWAVHDQEGRHLGRVEDLFVNTETELVESIELDNGQRYDTRQIEIGDHRVLVRTHTDRDERPGTPPVRRAQETTVPMPDPGANSPE